MLHELEQLAIRWRDLSAGMEQFHGKSGPTSRTLGQCAQELQRHVQEAKIFEQEFLHVLDLYEMQTDDWEDALKALVKKLKHN